ncbi:MAG: hypothetical protein J6I46_11810 [Ruminococcus sp.]|nr:hypothetical protein [Ruminococcus sp.]
MGRSLTSNHIFNAEKLTKAQFKKKFTDMMKAKGYTSAKADDGEISYALAFSGDRSWVTVLTEESTDTRKEASELAKNLGLQVLSVELVDSDFAEITLYEKSGAAVDTIFLGEPYFDEYPEPSPLKWQTLLNIDWAKVEEIQQGDHTFADDSLCAFGEVIGCENMLLEFDGADDDAVRLYFKKAGEKKLTLNAAFKQVFGEALEPLGFKKLKGKNIFVRLINNEIIHVIELQRIIDKSVKFRKPIAIDYPKTHDINKFLWMRSTQDIRNNYDQFEILCNVFTIFDDNPFWGINDIERMYYCIHRYDRDIQYMEIIDRYTYEKSNNESLYAAMILALDLTKKHILPALEDVNNIEKAIEHYWQYTSPWAHDSWYILYGNYTKKLNELFERKKQIIINDSKINPQFLRNGVTLEEKIRDFRCLVDKRINKFDEIIADKEKYRELTNEMENNKSGNILFLRKNGILVTEENEDEQIH